MKVFIFRDEHVGSDFVMPMMKKRKINILKIRMIVPGTVS